METKEAIKRIREHMAIHFTKEYPRAIYITEALEMAVEALEKQIPKMVVDGDWCPAKCPSCGRELSESLGDGYYKHFTSLEVCPNEECCQRLKWE